MKKYIKILIPLSTTLIPISIVGCTKHNEEGSGSFPKEWLQINGDYLVGFKPEHDTQKELAGYSVLTIPKEVSNLQNGAFSYDGSADKDGPLVIKKIDFEKDTLCRVFGQASFSGCANLTTVVFPPLFQGTDPNLFQRCSKLTTLDFTNVTVDLARPGSLISNIGISPTGQIIIKGDRLLDAVSQIKHKLGEGWTIVQK